MNSRIQYLLAGAAVTALLLLAGCNSNNVVSSPGSVSVIVSDDPTEDWATIGVKVLSISLVPQGGGTPVSVYTAPSTPPMINLVQLDQLGEILGNATVRAGTYKSAILTLGANTTGNPCDILLVASGDPEAGFDVPAGTTVPCSQIVVAGATTTAPYTVQLTVNLVTPLTVTGTSSNALDLEFDLRHPALIVEHEPAGASAPTWVVNFNGPVRHHPRPDLTKLFMRHLYGQAVSVTTTTSTDDTLTIARAFPVHPITTPETATVVTTDTLPILADAANGTIFDNIDTKTITTIDNFSSVATALTTSPGMFVRIAARYQSNGTLVATRIYASGTFDNIWQNPEGHVLHVNTNTNTMWVTTEDGKATEVKIAAETNFYFQSNNTAIGTGTTFFDGITPGGLPNVTRGFKVNVTIDPATAAARPPTAQSVEIDVARYDGVITLPTTTDFDYTRGFAMADARGGNDNYHGSIVYATGTTTDQQGNADSNGFYWWDFGFPTLADTKSTAVADFVSATKGSTDFCQGAGVLPIGLSHATWNDPAASDTCAAEWTVLLPSEALMGTVTSAFSSNTNSFTYTVPLPCPAPGPQPVTVDLNTASGSATLVYDVDRQGNIITINPVDITTSGGMTAIETALVAGTPVKIFGVPQTGGGIQAYVLFYYTHTASAK
jgi:hypothetical protein